MPINTTRALRTLPELRRLVEAIRDAPVGEPETDAVEWKRALDLEGSADDRFNAARHVLGMGNRSPAVAGRSFEGCSYLTAGVEPGAVTGAPVCDPADIDNWLTRYVAPGSPRWHVTYVEVDARQVMVFTVEPPRFGDPIFTLQRDFDRARAGRVFVRRGGTTQEASPAEIRALEGRLIGARRTIELEVAPVGDPRIAVVKITDDAVARWISGEVERYHEALKRHRASRPSSIYRGIIGDPRSEAEYVEEVNRYLESSEARFVARSYQRAISDREGRLVLAVHNPTPGNFERVQVTLSLLSGVQAFFDATEPFEVFEAPKPPDELGDGSPIPSPAPLSLGALAGNVEHDTVVRDGRGLTVRFASRHLRPGATEALPPVYLSVPGGQEGENVQIAWRATSTSAESWVEGAFSLCIESDASDLSSHAGPPVE